jgi:iron complex transport system substrate-binding protein
MMYIPGYSHGIVLCLLLPSLAAAQISVIDDLGRGVTLPAPARRIVSLAPSITESLFAIGASDQIIGVTDYCSYPPAAQEKAHVGGMINPSIESIIALQPTLIILSMEGNLREDFDRLQTLQVPIVVSNPRTLEGIYRSLQQLGELTGHEAEAGGLVRELRAREDSIRSRVHGANVRTLMIVSLHPLITVGGRTFLNELLQTAGGENLASGLSSTYPTYSREALTAQDPDVILVMSDVIRDVGDLVRYFPEWRNLTATKRHHIFRINADIVSRPGPRAIEGLEELYRVLHTEPGTQE